MNTLARSKISFTKTRSLLARRGKFGNRADEIKYENILLKNDFSINLPNEMFTNFVSSSSDGDLEQKKCLHDLKNKFVKDFDVFESGFEIIELIGENDNLKRLLRIINHYPSNNFSTWVGIIKCKNKRCTGFQLYLYIKDKTLNIILIDLYHLGLTADNHKNGQLIRNDANSIAKIYKKRKNRNYCISNILKQDA